MTPTSPMFDPTIERLKSELAILILGAFSTILKKHGERLLIAQSRQIVEKEKAFDDINASIGPLHDRVASLQSALEKIVAFDKLSHSQRSAENIILDLKDIAQNALRDGMGKS